VVSDDGREHEVRTSNREGLTLRDKYNKEDKTYTWSQYDELIGNKKVKKDKK
jgi:hypothetical protein